MKFIRLPNVVLSVAFACLALSSSAVAQGHGFKEGQKIQWKDRISGQWQEGTFLYETPGGKQPVIQQRPGDPGSQTAYNWDGIRQPMAVQKPAAPATPGKPNQPAPAAAPAAPDGPPLTEDDIKKFFTGRIAGTWSDDPEKFRQVKAELDNLIKKRGTTFIYSTGLNDFGTWLSEHGMGYNGPISHNYGVPNSQDWLFGSWITSITGLPVRWVEGDKLITWTEIGASKTGTVTINKDGTYRWDTQSAQGVIQGKWHTASADEMGDQGGAGVVLEGAKNGEPWVAFKYRASNPGEEWLGLAEVNRRSVREGAMRIPGGK